MGLEALYSLDRLCLTQQQDSKEACIHSAVDGDGLCFNCAEAQGAHLSTAILENMPWVCEWVSPICCVQEDGYRF